MCTCPGHFCTTRKHFVATCAQWTLPSSKRRVSRWGNHFVRARFGPHSLQYNVEARHFITLFLLNWKKCSGCVCSLMFALRFENCFFYKMVVGLNTTAHRRSRWNKRCYKIDLLKNLCLDVFSVDYLLLPWCSKKCFGDCEKDCGFCSGKWDRYTVDISHFQTNHSIRRKLIDDWAGPGYELGASIL